MNERIFGGAVVAVLFSSVAIAQPAPSVPAAPAKPLHTRGSFFTSNQSRADIPAHIARLFKQLDLNRDGFITKDEIASSQTAFDDKMAKSAGKRSAKAFDRLDTNHDGQITEADIDAAKAARAAKSGKESSSRRRAGTPALFARADANKDGIVTRAEYDAAVASGKIKVRHSNMRGSAIVRQFEAADVNHDGRVSLEEAQQAALRQFDIADANHDGVLTPDERRMASKANRTRKRAA